MGAPLKLLIVEDSEDDAELLAAEIARGTFRLDWKRVETLAEVRRALATESWDVIVSDYHVRAFTAEQVLAVTRESGKDLPFIIVSGVVQADQVVSLLKSGAHDFLNKDALARLAPAIEREVRDAEQRRQRRAAEERVRILSAAVEQSPVSVVITDRDGIISYVNPRFEQVAGYSAAEAVGRRLDFTCVAPDGREPMPALWETLNAGEEWRGEFCNERRDGQLFWEYATVSPLTNDAGVITHFVAVKEDITVRRTYEERLLRQAHYDPLTDLPNRLLMGDRLDQAVALAHRNGTLAALLYIDLDRFKSVNDAQGHGAGDKLLKDAAARLSGCVRETDTVARLGGDEFIVVLPDVADRAAVQRAADRVVKAFGAPFRIDGQEHFVTASIGITLYPTDSEDREALLHNADLAMYKAKERGRNAYHFFTAQIDQESQERLALEAKLRGAAARGELALYYQPIIDIQADRPAGYEALMRWRQADGRFCPPDQFIPVAEDLGLIVDMGRWALRTALSDLPALSDGDENQRVAVNVSPHQLRVAGFAPMVMRLLEESGISPERLELEITESVLLEDQAETEANLGLLCDYGVRLSIDDFGTGYSSLRYLQRFPFSTLKIDRSFVSGPGDAPTARRLVETIIIMAHGMGLDVVAEGVETPEQLGYLHARGCDMAQGYFYDRPQSLAEIAVRRRRVGRRSDGLVCVPAAAVSGDFTPET
jgi:diguanylate cyclase (GGDEF)-like protein/PAS domain S-box-containing protein